MCECVWLVLCCFACDAFTCSSSESRPPPHLTTLAHLGFWVYLVNARIQFAGEKPKGENRYVDTADLRTVGQGGGLLPARASMSTSAAASAAGARAAISNPGYETVCMGVYAMCVCVCATVPFTAVTAAVCAGCVRATALPTSTRPAVSMYACPVDAAAVLALPRW